jgi:hypothetical protein
VRRLAAAFLFLALGIVAPASFPAFLLYPASAKNALE